MRLRTLTFAAALALAACGPAKAPESAAAPAPESAAPAPVAAATIGGLSIESPVANAPQPGQTTGVAYMVIRNSGADADKLVSVTSPAADPVEMHAHTMAGGVMKMEKVAAIDIPANGAATLEPGGLHLMLFNFTPTGERITLRLKFEKAGEGEVEVPVAGAGAMVHGDGEKH